MPSPRVAELVGRVFGGRYRLTRPIGTGASAQVYAAEDVTLRRRVAVKVLHPALAGDLSFGPRFKAEARAVASLRHPNIATVFDWGEEEGWSYLVMELLEGGSLRSILDRGHLLSPAQAAAAGADAARALEHAHKRGLVHRDIKPANLIFDDEGRVRVADFGLARALAEATWTEPMGAVVGTARYCSPEQARGEPLDGRADVYSLALVLIEATTGKVPFTTDTTMGTVMARLERPIPVPPELGALGAALEGGGALEAARRLDAGELADALDEAVRLLPTAAPLPLARHDDHVEPVEDHDPTRLTSGPVLFDSEARRLDDGFQAPSPGASSSEQPAPRPSRRRPRVPRAARPRRRKGRVALALALVVVVLGGGGAAAYVLTRPPPKHLVPLVTGKPQGQATAVLAHLHFHLVVVGHSY
ncbi:MAG: serine/threonine-protein kinase, partial [Acidimicrobiales bacterium]